MESADLSLEVNEVVKQSSNLSKLITNIPEIIHHISLGWELKSGDLIYTGTPYGVGPVVVGDLMTCKVTGLKDLNVRMI